MGLRFSNNIFDPEHCWECRERARGEIKDAMTPLERHLLDIIELLLPTCTDTDAVEGKLEPEVLAELMNEPWRGEEP